jgi:hypothetical protein
MKTKRQSIREKRKRAQRFTRLGLGAVGLILVGVLAYAFYIGVRPAAGESVPVMPDSSHIADDASPPQYSTDPPTSGPHYAGDLEAGFIEEADLAGLPANPHGYLVHNLEHGYVIFWYNCSLLDEAGCTKLKADIRSVMDRFNGIKLIAFPWESIDVPLVMTSWGHLKRFERFDANQASDFIERNRNRAPEPNAP